MCEAQVKGYTGAKYKSFSNAADAEAFVSGSLTTAPPSPAKATSSTCDSSDYKGKKRTMRENVQDESRWDVVYSDGACKGNGTVGSYAGVGVWWGENDPRNIAERCPGDQTNNRAELIAIMRVLETTPKSKRPLLIKTDSQYSIKCFDEWLPGWVRNNFRTAAGQPVKNPGIIRYLAALFEARKLFGQEVRLQYVKGHSGDRGNDGADTQANIGAHKDPVPERDWAKLEREVKACAEEERRTSIDKPAMVPLQVATDDLPKPTETPRKMRKVSHELPFSRLPPPISPTRAAPKTPPLSKSIHTGPSALTFSTEATPSPPPPLSRTAAVVSSSPSNGTRTSAISSARSMAIAQTTTLRHEVFPYPTEPAAVSATAAQSLSPRKARNPQPHRLDSSSRQHSCAASPSPSRSPGIVRKFTDLPSASERALALGLVRTLHPPLPDATRQAPPPTPAKSMHMSVNKEDVDINDYLDCLVDDGDLSDDL
ncbi:ribonuclease H-like domain-containing protein [Lyophyllum atratum]|nr:ribonuclease H-like domain-containing protein [Lyophyllum atratum]